MDFARGIGCPHANQVGASQAMEAEITWPFARAFNGTCA
jgi:hypothetical protein